MSFAILDSRTPTSFRQKPTWFSKSPRLSRREDSARSMLRRSWASVSQKYPHCSEGIWTDFRLRESCGSWPHLIRGSRSTFDRNPAAAAPWRWRDLTHRLRLADRDGPGRGLQIRQRCAPALAPVNIIRRVVKYPKLALGIFGSKFRKSFFHDGPIQYSADASRPQDRIVYQPRSADSSGDRDQDRPLH
jgi:hypothetical protein